MRSCRYLRDLGISHLYLSPSLQARSGSRHGYDVIEETLWQQVSGDMRTFGEVAHEAKLEQVHGPFWQDVERLARELQGAELPAGLEGLA